jgi:hypothetical protein
MMGARRQIHHYFYEMKVHDVNRVHQFNARIIEGTRNFHQIKIIGLDKKFLHVCNLSCFCRFYFDGRDGPCNNEAYVAPIQFFFVWNLVM